MNIIEIKNLTFGYEDNPILSDVSIDFEKGKIHLIEGENGAGKTTLLKCITALINEGKNVYINGISVSDNKNVLSKVSYIMSNDTLYDYLTVNENILFYKSLFNEKDTFYKEVKEMLARLDCCQYLDYLVKNLSQGTRNKIYMAIFLMKNADIIILDEPFTALDGRSQCYFIEYMQKINQNKGKTILMVTHIEQFKKIATNIVKITKEIY